VAAPPPVAVPPPLADPPPLAEPPPVAAPPPAAEPPPVAAPPPAAEPPPVDAAPPPPPDAGCEPQPTDTTARTNSEVRANTALVYPKRAPKRQPAYRTPDAYRGRGTRSDRTRLRRSRATEPIRRNHGRARSALAVLRSKRWPRFAI